jgi:hypothetical protein
VHKDGSALRFRYLARETRVAGMTVYIAVGSPDPCNGGV